MDEEHDHAGQQCGNDGYVGYDAGDQSRTEQRHRNKCRHDVPFFDDYRAVRQRLRHSFDES